MQPTVSPGPELGPRLAQGLWQEDSEGAGSRRHCSVDEESQGGGELSGHAHQRAYHTASVGRWPRLLSGSHPSACGEEENLGEASGACGCHLPWVLPLCTLLTAPNACTYLG